MPSVRLRRSIHVGPELELLLCCMRGRADRAAAERMRFLVGAGLSWSRLFNEAVPHGMLPLVYWNLYQTCPDITPAETLQQLRIRYEYVCRRNRKMIGELLNIVKQFEAGGIAAMPFKGSVVSSCFYDDIGLREFCDLDI